MDHEVPDSTDWLKTPLQGFAELENALHCQVCKEFYDTPMLTSCSHSFCSKCIRTCLSSNGRCPACRASDQASKLRNNWALQEIVSAFLAARPAALSFAKSSAVQSEKSHLGKRKRSTREKEDGTGENETHRYPTRRRQHAEASSQQSAVEVIDESDDDKTYVDDDQLQAPDDGLVECPLGCGKRMKIEAVEPHLDRCEDERRAAEQRPSSHTPTHGRLQLGAARQGNSTAPRERLAELNYSLMKDAKLASKLKELGIPNWGNRTLLIRRHTEWVNIWNAECDSSRPRSKREMLSQLDSWERTQGGRAPASKNSGSTVMQKDFDGAAWATSNRDDFDRLIEAARSSRAKPAQDAETSVAAVENYNASEVESTTTRVQTANDKSSSDLQPLPEQPDGDLPKSHDSSSAKAYEASEGGEHKHDDNESRNVENPIASRHVDVHYSHAQNDTPCDLPAHFAISTESTKQVPMFAVPQQAANDINHRS